MNTHHRHYLTVAKALGFISQYQHHQPSLAAIADHCAMSEFHFQKVFTEWAGVSPKEFLQHLTREQAKSRLLSGESLLKASSNCGFSSTSRLYDLMVKLEAVTPGELKSCGAGIQLFYGVHPSPFGQCFIVTTHRGIHRLDFIDDDDDVDGCLLTLVEQWPNALIVNNQQRTGKELKKIFSSESSRSKEYGKTPKNAPLKLWLAGSQFQLQVWQGLLRIPPGKLASYAAIAHTIGKPLAARAVGTAIAKNPIAMLIPCHRVIKGTGSMGNYRWGTDRKQALIGYEAALTSSKGNND